MNLETMSQSTICAVATAPGGAIGLVRVSGTEALTIVDRIFRPAGKRSLSQQPSHTLSFGKIETPAGECIDEVLVSVFRAPHSYTGENSVEISSHGSGYILNTVVRLLIEAGCRAAEPGEFTRRAYLNGKMDLSQAEAVADVIASSTEAAHRVAMSQMRGEFSRQLGKMREQLLRFASLLELELDFSDHEDLEFADRCELDSVAGEVETYTSKLASSFAAGNVLRNGLPVAIVGSTNSGKSTLLNALLHDDRAIVSDVHGTTRDVIEDTFTIGGYLFRFTDTAGLRTTTDRIEQLGIERSRRKLEEAAIVLFVMDAIHVQTQWEKLGQEILKACRHRHLIVLLNKCDMLIPTEREKLLERWQQYIRKEQSDIEETNTPIVEILSISARQGIGLEQLTDKLIAVASTLGRENSGELIVTNARHYAALIAALDDIRRVRSALQTGLPGDLIAQDLHECLFHLAEITGGAITSDTVLKNIFSHFCIGK